MLVKKQDKCVNFESIKIDIGIYVRGFWFTFHQMRVTWQSLDELFQDLISSSKKQSQSIFVNEKDYYALTQVVIQARHGSGFAGDIAIDDLEFTDGSCALTPANACPKPCATVAPTAIVTTVGPTVGELIVFLNLTSYIYLHVSIHNASQ